MNVLKKNALFLCNSPWETNLKSIPFNVVLSWKQCSRDVFIVYFIGQQIYKRTDARNDVTQAVFVFVYKIMEKILKFCGFYSQVGKWKQQNSFTVVQAVEEFGRRRKEKRTFFNKILMRLKAESLHSVSDVLLVKLGLESKKFNSYVQTYLMFCFLFF